MFVLIFDAMMLNRNIHFMTFSTFDSLDSGYYWRLAIMCANWMIIPILENTYSDLIFNAGGIEKRLDLLPQFPPWPGAEFQVSTQGTLDNGKSHTLFLQLLELFAVEETTSPGLHPWHDTGKTFITEFFHLTQDTSTEEDLYIFKFSRKRSGKQ